MTAANHYTPSESERRGAAGSRLPMKRFFGRMTAELKESKAVLLVWGAFCTMLTVSSAIDPLGGEMLLIYPEGTRVRSNTERGETHRLKET